jgi:predicted nucleic acid-binding Zn ribbon protein
MPAATCAICDTPLPPFPPAGPPLCGSLPCSWKYQVLPKEHLCQVCGRLLSVPDRSVGACSDRRCWLTLSEERRRVRQAELEAEAAALCAAAAEQFPQLRDRSIPITIIPAYSGTSTRIPNHRRAALERRLTRLVQQPAETPPEAPTDQPSAAPAASTEAALQAACTNCRGVCCANGNDHAYLTPETLHRVRAANPGLSDDQIVALYLSHVGPRGYAGSCIFHQSTGCALPRAMRSDTCNSFFCSPMREFMTGAARDPAAPVFLAAVDNRAVRAGVLVSESQVERVRPAPKRFDRDSLPNSGS